MLEDIYAEFEAIKKGKWQSKSHRLFQQMITDQLQIMQEYQQPICEIGGDQTKVVNSIAIEGRVQTLERTIEVLHDAIECLKIENPNMPGDVVTKITQLENQIKQLRYEGVSMALGASYTPGHAHADDRNKPDIADYALGYSIDGTKDVHGELQDELKNKFREMGLVDDEPIVEVDAGFGEIPFDPNKCREPILKDGQLSQCARYPDAGSKYCWQHKKKYEDRQFT